MVAQQLEDGCADLTEVSSVGLMIAVMISVEPNGLYRCMRQPANRVNGF